jgi:hypothetical protein
LVSFLIRRFTAKYSRKPGGLKFDRPQFGWFNLFLDPFFEGIVNLQTKMLDLACVTCYTPNSDGNTRSRWGGLLQFGWFNLHLDSNFEKIPDQKWEI